LNSSEPIDLDKYEAPSAGRPFPRKGRYVVRAADITSESFGQSQAGYLTVQIDPTIVGPTDEGYQIRYVKQSAKTFTRGKSNTPVSQMGDFLLACGHKGAVPSDPAELANLVSTMSGTVFQADVDWRAYNKNNGFSLEGMEKFPKDVDGEYLPWVEDPSDIDAETGNPRRLRANLNVNRCVAA